MILAVVGSREGADLDHVRAFVSALPPSTRLLSGGAKGVDHTAEQTWLSLGGRVLSFRPTKLDNEDYGIQVWELGGPNPKTYTYEAYPTAADYKSACGLRNILIAETCDRLVAFYKHGKSRGAAFTRGWAHDQGKPTFEYQA